MSSQKYRGVGRRLATVVGLATSILAVGASAAFASVTLNPAAPGPYTAAGQTIKVRGTAPAEATEVAVAVCNVKSGVVPGTRCDGAKAIPGLKPVSEYQSKPAKLSIEVRRGPWQDWNFTKGSPEEVKGSTTTCKNTKGEGDQCAVVVSYYKNVGGIPVQLTGTEDIAKIEFS